MTREKVPIGIEEQVEERSPVSKGFLRGQLTGSTALKACLTTTRHGFVYGSFSYRDLAKLLTREDLERISTEITRDSRFSGVECLDDIDGSAVSLDDYADATENSVRPRHPSARTDTIEVKRRHLQILHHSARLGHKSRALKETLEATEHLV